MQMLHLRFDTLADTGTAVSQLDTAQNGAKF